MKHYYIITLFFIVCLFSVVITQDEFMTTWQTTSSNKTITIPTTESGYNYSLDWGDGVQDNTVPRNASRTFETLGIYTLIISSGELLACSLFCQHSFFDFENLGFDE